MEASTVQLAARVVKERTVAKTGNPLPGFAAIHAEACAYHAELGQAWHDIIGSSAPESAKEAARKRATAAYDLVVILGMAI